VKTKRLPSAISRQIEMTVQYYIGHRSDFLNLAKRIENDLIENATLKAHIHSTKYREKDPDHLRDKLRRKAHQALQNGVRFEIVPENLFQKIDDLAGVRLLHVYREQLRDIDPMIREILKFHKHSFREEPKAFTWDVESESFFRKLGFKVETNPKFYTSVHYIVQPHFDGVGCEIQVRTLAEELWGEVSHTINYPHQSESIACREQLAVLARTASSCTRLVDSIFASEAEFKNLNGKGTTGLG
jgi:ppGpp synthetase/RelA/SpoT-type nucleotidyltranferase